MNYAPSITKEEISTLPVEAFPGKIIVIDKIKDLDEAIGYISVQHCVGFDTETRPNFSKKQHHKVSLIQISLEDTCFLFRLNKLGGIPASLMDFFKNKQVTKVGLSLLDDFHGMRKLAPIDPLNFIDLQKFVPSFGIEDASLQKIYAILFGKKISKKKRALLIGKWMILPKRNNNMLHWMPGHACAFINT